MTALARGGNLQRCDLVGVSLVQMAGIDSSPERTIDLRFSLTTTCLVGSLTPFVLYLVIQHRRAYQWFACYSPRLVR